MSYKIMDGNEACATVSYKFTEVAGIYPITPASPIAELTDSFSGDGKKNFFNTNVRVVEMQSEAGAAGMVHGSLQAGCLTTTYTASQGLLLMIPNMYKIAGEQLPGVIHVAARSLATHALSIFGDHQDIYATRMTGFAILASSSVQQVMDLTSIAHLSALKGSVPFLNFFDGFRTSHELQKIEVIDLNEVEKLIDQKALDRFRKKALNISNPVTRGTSQNDDIYFQMTESRNKYYDELPNIVEDYMREISKITKRDYQPFNYYGSDNATRVIVAMGSVCETIKEVVDKMNENNEKVGLIEVHLYRPFSSKHLLKVLPITTKKIAVLDRTKEAGSNGEPLYLDVQSVIKEKNLEIEVLGGRYGLSSKNTTPSMIYSVYEFLNNRNRFSNFTVGITDDVTNRSIEIKDFESSSNSVEFLIYGYGSDGMVSACKDLMKITGTFSRGFVQGYFQYDSKKSGGVTKSHLRFSKKPITSTYYVENPDLVMCTKESYLSKFEMLKGIKSKGTFIINTDKNKDELLNLLTERDKRIIVEQDIKVYTIDASKITNEVGLGNKISTVMETIIFKLGRIIDFEFAREKIKESVHKKFETKGNDLESKNIEAIDKALDTLQELDFSNISYKEEEKLDDKSLFEIIDSREGDSLKVSAFMNNTDGTFKGGMSSLDKRNVSHNAPEFIKENCISCNMCSFVCPHAVIRPFLLDEEEVNNAPESLKEQLLDANIKGENLKYIVSVSVSDCTGCGLCVNVCPGKKQKKALTFKQTIDLKNEGKEEEFEYLINHVKEKDVMNIDTVKGSQFKEPKFAFSGACAGCGETPYLKLITQLFGDNMMIANATGCSSIYGGSLPSTAYTVPWANSLFEDNAEFGFGMKIADNAMKDRIRSLIEENISIVDDDEIDVYTDYLDEVTKQTADRLYEIVDSSKIEELRKLKDYIKPKSIWCVGGDGWAYDIGFAGIDHVLSNNENINILVLDTEVYSNTGGQSSKSSKIGSIAKFTAKGKETAKKDLAKIALTYPHVYVGSIAIGGNMQHTVKTLVEAESYDGPSIVFAYSPCISQGILTGMETSIEEEKKAVNCGYYPLFHYDPRTKKFSLDARPDFNKYYEFIAGEDRYRMLKKINPDKYRDLLEQNRLNAIERYRYYEKLEKESNEALEEE